MDNVSETKTATVQTIPAAVKPSQGTALKYAQLLAEVFIPTFKGGGKSVGTTISFEGTTGLRNASLTLLDNGLVELIVGRDVVLIPVTMFKAMVPK